MSEQVNKLENLISKYDSVIFELDRSVANMRSLYKYIHQKLDQNERIHTTTQRFIRKVLEKIGGLEEVLKSIEKVHLFGTLSFPANTEFETPVDALIRDRKSDLDSVTLIQSYFEPAVTEEEISERNAREKSLRALRSSTKLGASI